MTGAEVFLWPLLGFFVIAALAAAWTARNPEAESASRKRLLELDWELPRWRQMPKWESYQAHQQAPVRIARAGRRAALIYASIAAAILAYLLTRS